MIEIECQVEGGVHDEDRRGREILDVEERNKRRRDNEDLGQGGDRQLPQKSIDI